MERHTRREGDYMQERNNWGCMELLSVVRKWCSFMANLKCFIWSQSNAMGEQSVEWGPASGTWSSHFYRRLLSSRGARPQQMPRHDHFVCKYKVIFPEMALQSILQVANGPRIVFQTSILKYNCTFCRKLCTSQSVTLASFLKWHNGPFPNFAFMRSCWLYITPTLMWPQVE
jgi:hypothetical protein